MGEGGKSEGWKVGGQGVQRDNIIGRAGGAGAGCHAYAWPAVGRVGGSRRQTCRRLRSVAGRYARGNPQCLAGWARSCC